MKETSTPCLGLSGAQVEQVREATERILERTGVRVQHAEARERLRGCGAQVDDDGVVRLPPDVLRELIGRAPARCAVTGIDGIERVIGGDRPWGGAIVTDPWIVDCETRRPRRPCRDDIRRNTLVAQQLEFVLGASCMDFPVTDVAGPSSNLRALETHLLHHAKHNFVYATSPESLERWLRIGRILTRGGELRGSGLFTVAVAVTSPLVLTDINVELLKTACDYGFPVVPTVCPTAGMTSPFTLAGTLAQANAEILFVLALTQAYRPGHPFLYACGPAVGDMRGGECLYYTLDKVLWKTASIQLGRSYGVPVAAESGGAMGCGFDQQNGAEGMLFMLSAVLAGADLLAGFGSTLNAVGHSTEMMLIQEAWLKAASFLARGMSVDDRRLGLESIHAAGPGGNFLTDGLTLDNLRGVEFFAHDLFEASGRPEPTADMVERAHAGVAAMTAGAASPVPPDIQEALRGFFDAEGRRVEGG